MVRSLLLFLILIIFFLPLVQRHGHFPKQDFELHGYNESSSNPTFSWKTFFDGTYQDQLSTYLQENVGYKGYLIALKNQIDYFLFNHLNYGIEKGGDGQLFYWYQIDNHCGHLTLSNDSLQKKIKECIALKALLDSLHTKMFFVLAACKPNYYEDNLPERFHSTCKGENDYQQVLSLLRKNNLEILDFNEWFKKKRTDSPFPLFPKLGTHWSFYGATVAIDSLSKFMEQSLQTNLTEYSITKTEITNQPKGKDKDLWDLLNVFIPMQSDSLCYPQFKFTPTNTASKKPKLLLIGDSFNWTLLDTKILPQLFSADSRFWFYKRELYDLNGKWITSNPNEVDLYKLLKGTDVVIFLSTEALCHRLDHGLSNAVFSNQLLVDSLIRNR